MSKPRIQLICNSCNNTRTANVRHTHDNHRNTSEAEFENDTELVKERLTLAYYIVKQEEYEVHMTSRQAMTKKRQGPPTQRIPPGPASGHVPSSHGQEDADASNITLPPRNGGASGTVLVQGRSLRLWQTARDSQS